MVTARFCKTAASAKNNNKTTEEMEDSVSAGPHQTEASSYLREHRIMELLHNLTSALVYHKPADPKAYMREYIEQLQRAKSDPDQVEVPCLIDESNIKSVGN